MAKEWMQGWYKPQNPKKYKGNPTKIAYRSSYELAVMRQLDSDPTILEWNSERVVLGYVSPVDNKWHRYFVDLYYSKKMPDGSIKKVIVEIKPESQCKKPVKTKGKKQLTYLKESMTFAVNQAKWDAAKRWADKMGYVFEIWSEQQIFGGKKVK